MSDQKNNRLDQIIKLMETDDSVDAPTDSITWAKNLYRTRERKPSLITRLVASLQMDLQPGKAAFGERSGSTGMARQMLFNAGEHAIELRVIPENSKSRIQGQVLGEGFAGAELRLSNSDLFQKTMLGEMSEFEIFDVSKGFYTLTLRSADKEIVIEDVDI